ncbi:MAG: hypothetical protein K0R11_953, partial [Acidimicrobiales bacterium]|nr:hypothetical protein [Acidimicrobiales bacterium]
MDGSGTSPRRAARAAVVAVLLTLVVSGLPVVAGSPRAAAAGADLEVVGHGYGHGRGLGQWGALGYAVDAGWSAARIL